MAFPGNLAYRLSRHKSVFEHCRTCVRTLRSMLKYYLFHDRHCQISWKRSTALMQWLREGKSSSRFTSLATVPKSTYSVPYALKLANFGVALKLANGGSEACKYSGVVQVHRKPRREAEDLASQEHDERHRHVRMEAGMRHGMTGRTNPAPEKARDIKPLTSTTT